MADGKMKKKWVCKYCDGVNSRKELYCVGCGARWADLTHDLKEMYLEEMPTQSEETKSYPEETNTEDNPVEECAEKENKQKSISRSYFSIDDDIMFYNIKKNIKIIVVITFTFITIWCMFSTFNKLKTNLKDLEISYTYADENYEAIDE